MSTVARFRARAGAVLALAVVLALAGCTGGGEPETVDAGGDEVVDETGGGSGETGGGSGDVPPECLEAALPAVGPASLDDVALLPADWPTPPAGSTLCVTTEGFGDLPTESLSYATSASPDEVLAHYEAQLAAYAPAREPSPTGGEALVGQRDDLAFQLRAADGSFVLVLAPLG